MIDLKFKVLSCYHDEIEYNEYVAESEETTVFVNYEIKYEESMYEKSYPKETIFKDVLQEIYDQYGINNGNGLYYYIEGIKSLFWGQYFSQDLLEEIDCDPEEYEQLTLQELEKQFNISKIFFTIQLNPDGIGANMGEKEGISFDFMIRGERDLHPGKPHIHCSYAEAVVRIGLLDFEIIDKPFKSKKKMAIALQVIREHQEELLNYWNKVIMNRESFKFKLNI